MARVDDISGEVGWMLAETWIASTDALAAGPQPV